MPRLATIPGCQSPRNFSRYTQTQTSVPGGADDKVATVFMSLYRTSYPTLCRNCANTVQRYYVDTQCQLSLRSWRQLRATARQLRPALPAIPMQNNVDPFLQ